MKRKTKRDSSIDPRQMSLHLIGDFRNLEQLAAIDAANKRVTWQWVPALGYDVDRPHTLPIPIRFTARPNA